MSRKLLTSGRLTEYLVQGFASKNNRTRVDCVELLGQMLEEEGLNACLRTKQKPFALMAEASFNSCLSNPCTYTFHASAPLKSALGSTFTASAVDLLALASVSGCTQISSLYEAVCFLCSADLRCMAFLDLNLL